MRELTQEEIDLAPDWATHYFIDSNDGALCFESQEFYQYAANGSDKFNNHTGLAQIAKPIPRKAFDLSGYEFSDSDVSRVVVTKGIAYVYTSIEKSGVDFKKADIITIAKALGVTGDDLLERARGEA